MSVHSHSLMLINILIKLQFYGDKLNILYYKLIYFLDAWAIIHAIIQHMAEL